MRECDFDLYPIPERYKKRVVTSKINGNKAYYYDMDRRYVCSANKKIEKEKLMQLEIIKQELPIVEFNYDQMKQYLSIKLDEFKDIVVTEETLKDDKSTQKDLASLRIKLDNFRKDVKNELSKPIQEVEGKIKDLIQMVEAVEKPLKQGIDVFSQRERDLKREKCQEIATELIDTYKLNSKYASRIEIKDKFLNVTATVSSIKDDLTEQCDRLKDQQIDEEIIQETIENHIKSVNESYNLSVPLSAVHFDITYSTVGLTKAMDDINCRAKQQFDAEEAAKKRAEELMKPKVESVMENQTGISVAIPEKKFEENYTVAKDEPIWEFDFTISGATSNLKLLKEYLDNSNLTYVINRREKK